MSSDYRHCLSLAAALLLLIVTAPGCGGSKRQYYRETGSRFHTLYHITYEYTEPLTALIDSTLDRFEASLNPFDSTSLISAINRSETDQIDTMLLQVIETARRISIETDGAYDITGGPLFNAWGFGTTKGSTREVAQQEIDSILTFIGYDKVTLDTTSMRLTKSDPRVVLIPSSLSKGYAVDLVASALEQRGVTSYMVEIGGEIICKGKNPSGRCWRLGINKPIDDNTSEVNELIEEIDMCEKRGLATSGDYRNYIILENGRKVAHTIDVRTGHPAHSDILSATVSAPTCMEADGWATALMAIGLHESIKLLDRHPELSALLIYADLHTGALKSYHKGFPFTPQPPKAN